MKRFIAVLIFIFVGLSGLSFSEETTTPTTTTASQAVSQSNLNLDLGGGSGETPRQFIGATPGTSNDVFPGNAPSGKTSEELYVPIQREYTVSQIKAMNVRTKRLISAPFRKMFGGGKNVFFVPLNKKMKPNNDEMKIVNWDANRFKAYKEDERLGKVTVLGEAWWPEELFLAQGMQSCRENAGASRVSVQKSYLVVSTTKVSNKGLGNAASGVTGANSVGLGGAVGYSSGKAQSYPETWPVMSMVCLNDGPSDMLVVEQKKAEVAPSSKIVPSENKKEMQETVTAPKPPEQPAAKSENDSDWKKMSDRLMGVLENFSQQSISPSPDSFIDSFSIDLGEKKSSDVKKEARSEAKATVVICKKVVKKCSDPADKKAADIGCGEGFEHSFARQIVANPQYFYFKGDVADTVAVKKFAGRQAHQFAIQFKLVDSRKNLYVEARVKEANQISSVLEKDKDGKFVCKIFVRGADKAYPTAPQDVLGGPNSPAHFLGQPDSAGNFTFPQAYLYSWPKTSVL